MKTLFSGGLVFDGDISLLAGRSVLVENGRIAAVRPAGEFTGFAGETIDIAGMTIARPDRLSRASHHRRRAPTARSRSSTKLAVGARAARARKCAGDAARWGHVGARLRRPRVQLAHRARRDQRRPASWSDAPLCRPHRLREAPVGAHGPTVARSTPPTKPPGPCTEASRRASISSSSQPREPAPSLLADTTLAEMSPAALAASAAAGPRASVGALHATRRARSGLGNAVRAGVTSIEHGFTMSEADAGRDGSAAQLSRSHALPLCHVSRRREQSAIHGRASPAVERLAAQGGVGLLSRRRSSRDGNRRRLAERFTRENSQELRHLVAIGIRALDALRMATGRGADLLGLADRGRVKEGQRADLLDRARRSVGRTSKRPPTGRGTPSYSRTVMTCWRRSVRRSQARLSHASTPSSRRFEPAIQTAQLAQRASRGFWLDQRATVTRGH